MKYFNDEGVGWMPQGEEQLTKQNDQQQYFFFLFESGVKNSTLPLVIMTEI